MRSHAKASSAATTQRQATGLGRTVRGAFAGRGVASDADGSGAPSAARHGLIALAIALVGLMALAPAAFASKNVIRSLGSSFSGSVGGQFNSPRGVAVNSTGAGGASAGDFYVADTFNNRIQQFHSNGQFVRAWGQDVIGAAEVQWLIRERIIAGTYTLTFEGQTTAPLAYNAGGGAVRSALEALSTIGAGNVTVGGVGGDTLAVTFEGALEGTDLPELTVDTSKLEGGTESEPATITVETKTNGFGGVGNKGFEICEEAEHCKAGITSVSPAPGGEMSEPRGIAVDQSTGAVYVTDRNFLRVQKFSATGEFQAAFGKDVKTGGVTTTEVCTVASECKTGVTGEAGGEFKSNFEGYLAVAPSGSPSEGNVYVADRSNRRVQEFDSSGNFVETFGADVNLPAGGTAFEVCTVPAECKIGASGGSGEGQFANNSPERVAVDDAGRIYAIDNNNSRIQRFTSAPAFDTLYGTTELSGSPAPTDIAIDPGATSAGDASDDHVFVVKPSSSPSERRIKELGTEADPTLIDTHMVGAGISTVNGLGLDTATGRMFVSTFLSGIGNRILTVDDALPDPTVVLKGITTKTDTTATLKATIDPMGGDVGCTYEYSTDEEAWTELEETDCATLAGEGGAQAVTEQLAELVPNQLYYVRLIVTRPWPPASSATSDIRVFNTDAVPPVVSDLGSIPVSKSSERLAITIDAKHSPTSYVFQYGTTPSLGSQTAPLAIGSANEALTFSQVVTGLSPDTTYYYRAVATNPTGPSNSAVSTFHTRATDPPAADQRGYEMVSPPDKNNGDADAAAGPSLQTMIGVAADGQSTAFCTLSVFGEPPAGLTQPSCVGYLSRRGAHGWETRAPYPRYCHLEPEIGSYGGNGSLLQLALNANMTAGVLAKFEPKGCELPPLDPSAPFETVTTEPETGQYSANVYRDSLYSDPSDPAGYQLVNSEVPYDIAFQSGSENFEHVVFQSRLNQTEPPDSPAPGSFNKLYDWTEGSLKLVTRDPSNEPFTTASAYVGQPGMVSFSSPTTSNEYNGVTTVRPESGVSRSGDRIFFQNPQTVLAGLSAWTPSYCTSTACHLFMREGGTTTYEVSASECTVECGAVESAAQFADATPNGDVAFFGSCAKLTDASAPGQTCQQGLPLAPIGGSSGTDKYFEGGQGDKLYRWDVNAPSGSRLTDLTIDHEPADGIKPSAIGITGISDDGKVVYFAAGGQLVAGAPIIRGGKLYRWDWNEGDPTVEYLTTIKPTSPGGAPRDEEASVVSTLQVPYDRVTPDGKYLVLVTETAVLPAVDRDQNRDVYRWSRDDGWLCISCQAPGTSSAGNANVGQETAINRWGYNAAENGTALKTSYYEPFVSDDGQRIFFETPDALVPEDVNGELGCPRNEYPRRYTYACDDVYEWHDGGVRLISTGTAPGGSYLAGMDHSGENVLFTTRQQLVGWDVDQNTDIYDARIGGGFPEPPPQPAACEGEACRGATTSAPSGQGAGTAVFQGPGNPTPKHAKARKKKKHKKRRHRKHRRGSKQRKHGRAKRKARRHANRTAKHNRRAAR